MREHGVLIAIPLKDHKVADLLGGLVYLEEFGPSLLCGLLGQGDQRGSNVLRMIAADP